MSERKYLVTVSIKVT